MKKIIGKLGDIISEEEWDLLYYEVREKVLNDILKEKYVKMILGDEERRKVLKILNDNK